MNRKVRISLIIYEIILFLLILPPYISVIFPQINKIVTIVKYLVLIYSIINLKSINIKKIDYISGIFLLLLIFMLNYFISTIINELSISAFFTFFLSVFIICIFTLVSLEKDGENFIKAATFVFKGYIIINFLTIIFFRNGLYESVTMNGILRTEKSYFLGHKNNMINYIYIGLLLIITDNLLKEKKLTTNTIFYIIISLLSCIIGQSVTSIVSLMVLILGLLFMKNKKNSKIQNVSGAIWLNLLFFITFIFLKLEKYMEYILVDLFERDLQLNGRTTIWGIALDSIKNKPLIGNGIDISTNVMLNYNVNNSSFHNLVLDILFEGGIIGLIIFILTLLYIGKNIKKLTNQRLKKFFNIFIFSMSIIWLSQPLSRSRFIFIFLPFLIISYYIKKDPVDIDNLGGQNYEN